jgi:hypothetical protein
MDAKEGRNMNAKYFTIVLYMLLALFPAYANAGTYGFEDGTDEGIIPAFYGMTFSSTDGHPWIFGDWRVTGYEGPWPTGPYFSNGNFFAWTGPEGNAGKISFTNPVPGFTVGYSSPDAVMMSAFTDGDVLVDSDTGTPNLSTGQLSRLSVQGAGIKYVIINGRFGNYWLIDDIGTGCTTDADCDDGLFCNGQETCDGEACVPGTIVDCADDGNFCNGQEYCDESADLCANGGDPCTEQQICDEESDSCLGGGNDDVDDDDGDDDGDDDAAGDDSDDWHDDDTSAQEGNDQDDVAGPLNDIGCGGGGCG